MRVLSTGEVGIGTPSPTNALQVDGTFRNSFSANDFFGGTYTSTLTNNSSASSIASTAPPGPNIRFFGQQFTTGSFQAEAGFLFNNNDGTRLYPSHTIFVEGSTGYVQQNLNGGSGNAGYALRVEGASATNYSFYTVSAVSQTLRTTDGTQSAELVLDLGQVILSNVLANGTNAAVRLVAGAGGDAVVRFTSDIGSYEFPRTDGAPNYVLTTNGAGELSWQDPVGSAWNLLGNGATDPNLNFLGTTDAQPLVIRTNNAERMRVLSTGEIGIGTATPAERLTIGDGTVDENMGIDVGADGTASIFFKYGGVSRGSILYSDSDLLLSNTVSGTAGRIVLNTAGPFEEVYVTSTGLVGINESQPVNNMHVTINTTGATVANALAIDHSSTASANGLGTGLLFRGESTNGSREMAQIASVWTTVADLTRSSALTFSTVNSASALTERMRINASGEVGIGTTAVAGYSLHVAGTAGTANVRLGSVSGASITSAFTPTANDGLIVADVNGDLVKRSTSSVLNASAWLIGGNTLGAAGDLGTNDAFGLNIRTNSTSRITVSATGDVSVLGTAGTPNLTLTSVSGVAAGTVPVGYDRALIANASGQISQASFGAILASGAWTLTGNASTNPATNFLGTTDAVDLVVRTNNVERIRTLSTGLTGIGITTPTTQLSVRTDDAAAAAITDILTLAHSTTGTPALNMGAGLLFRLESSTTDNQDAARIGSIWTTVAHATRSAALTFSTVNSGGALTERMRLNAAGGLGIGITAVANFNLHVAGTAGTANVRLASLSGASVATTFTPGANDGIVVANTNGDLLKRSISSALNTSAWLVGGNTLGVAGSIGTNDAFDLNIETNNTNRLTITSAGAVSVLGTAGTPNLTITSIGGTAGATIPVGYDRVLLANGSGLVNQASLGAVLASGAWTLTGNTGTNPATNFLGTTDNVGLRFRTNNSERLVIDNTGRVGIGGSLSPSDALEVDNGNLRIATSGTGTAGSLRFEEDATNGDNYIGFRAPATLANNRTYTLPSTLGTVGQVLVISSTGGGDAVLDWGTDGTSIFEERPGSNAGIRRRNAYLFPSSPDGLVDIYANDFQGRRSAAGQTASGNYSGILAGQSNTASGTNSVVVGGSTNSALGNFSFVGAGQTNTADGTNGVIVGGNTNTMQNSSNDGFIGAGANNAIGPVTSGAIVAGSNNALTNSANYGFIGGGQDNEIANATHSSVLGGSNNDIASSSHRSVIIGGVNNTITATNPNSAIWGGQGLTLNAARTAGINLNDGTAGSGSYPMTISSTNTIVFGNGDLWLANTNNSAAGLRFYEPQAATGTFPAAATQYTSFRAGAQTVNIDYTLPTALPVANNHVMVSTTAGIMSWADPASLLGNVFWSLGGNAVASAQNLGTTSNFALPIITNNVERMRINATGEVGIGTTAAAGYSLHVGGTAGTPNVRLASVGGAANATAWVPTANDGVITADNNGDLSKRTAQAVVNAGLSNLSGTVNLTAGSTSIVVPNTNVTATSRIVVTYEDASAAGFVATMVTTRVVGASFTVAFSGPIPAGATGRLHYIIVNP